MTNVLLQVLKVYSVQAVREISLSQAPRIEAVLFPGGARYLFDSSSLDADDGVTRLAPVELSLASCCNRISGRWRLAGVIPGEDPAPGGGSGSASYPMFLDYDQDDSTGDASATSGGSTSIASPGLAFATDKKYDILITGSGATLNNATFTQVALDVTLSWTGGGGGLLTKRIMLHSIGAVTADSLQMAGQVLFTAVPAGNVTASYLIVGIGSVTGGIRRSAGYPPLTLKAEAIAAVA